MKKKSAVISILAVAVIFSLLFFFYLPSTGLLSLSQEEKPGKLVSETISAEEKIAKISPSLSYEILSSTELNARIVSVESITDCPETFNSVIEIENSGETKAEVVSISIEKGFSVKGCNNCKIPELNPKEKSKIELNLCRISEQNPVFLVKAVNAKPIKLFIE